MIDIRLDEKWILRADEKQWLLGYESLNKGELKFNSKFYFTELDSLVKFYFDLKLRTSQARDFTELASNIAKIKRSIELALKPIKLANWLDRVANTS
jgi:hypothetical protein